MAALVFRWEWSLNGLPESECNPFLCFLATTLGPDSANNLALGECDLPDATLSSPQSLLLPHQLSSTFSPGLCELPSFLPPCGVSDYALHLGKLLWDPPKVLYFSTSWSVLPETAMFFCRGVSLTKQKDSSKFGNNKAWICVFYLAGCQSCLLSLCPENRRDWQMSF